MRNSPNGTTQPYQRSVRKSRSYLSDGPYRLRLELHISQQSWAEACEVLGRIGASLCVLITDQGSQRAENRVTQPAAYFRGMVNRARARELRLHNSIFGLIRSHTVREGV